MIAEFETRILTLIDDMVESASDDELFASGYLQTAKAHRRRAVSLTRTPRGSSRCSP